MDGELGEEGKGRDGKGRRKGRGSKHNINNPRAPPKDKINVFFSVSKKIYKSSWKKELNIYMYVY